MRLELAAERAVPGFTLAVEAGFSAPVTGIVGPSGAGKTTLLHLVTGLLRPTRGRVALDGEVLAAVADGGRAVMVPAHRRRVAAVFQDGRLFPHLDVAGNLRYGMRRVTQRAGAEPGPAPDYDEVVEMLALAPLLARRTGTLSGGERQRVALGRALLCAPRLLVLDEPLGALDGALRRQVLPFLKRVRERGVPMLYVAHDPEEVLYLAGELALLAGGKLRGHGTVRALAARADLLDELHALGLHNVLAGTVAASSPGETVLALESAGPPVLVHAPPGLGAVGTARTVAIRPADLSLARRTIAGISIRNQLAGTVVSVATAAARTLVTVDMGGIELRAEVSPAAVSELGLAPGATVVCLFKAQALRAVDGA
jgi:molybdate transport system ATP-binding protein